MPLAFRKESFIAMVPSVHDERRKTVNPIVAPPNLMKLSGTIRKRACRIPNDFPHGKIYD
ncbi:MAG: hypothetical protein EXR09_01895 [Acetobacteraceae bacterium]|nr:hypothetical protein [Acetobacteraceae bacterium]